MTLDKTGFTIVMGPNGSGKTTLLRLMHGLERPRSGSVEWAVETSATRGRQSFIFQTPVLMRRSVLDNIAYPLQLRKMPADEVRKVALKWAKVVELDRRTELDAQLLSGGERQKLAIARALITDPEVLFLDEPTTNLDGASMREIESIIKTANRNGTRIVMTTHDIGQARRLASDIWFINKGNICEHQSAEKFFAAPQSQAARAYVAGDIVE
ncbi:MAG: ATP-binding cassette domain-containing protein [Rhizobiaceae bacterium]|nr:ATP-binding cassette domain-containing protein [Rhizobiaceae bacterium]